MKNKALYIVSLFIIGLFLSFVCFKYVKAYFMKTESFNIITSKVGNFDN